MAVSCVTFTSGDTVAEAAMVTVWSAELSGNDEVIVIK